MRDQLAWVFDNPRRLRQVSGIAILLLLALLAGSLAVRLTGGGPATAPVVTVTSRPVDTDLIAPSPEQTDVPATLDYGSSTSVALEVVQAFLDHDLPKFDAIAGPEAAESVNAAPAPRAGQKIIGNATITEPGPTQQTVRVPTTDGVLEVVMIVQGGAWRLDSIKYVR